MKGELYKPMLKAFALGWVGGIILLMLLLTVSWFSGVIEEKTVLGAMIALIPVFAVSAAAVCQNKASTWLGKTGLAVPLVFGSLAIIVSLFVLTALGRTFLNMSGYWDTDSLSKGIAIAISFYIGAHVMKLIYNR